MGGGPPRFPQGFSSPTVLRCLPHEATPISPTGFSPSVIALPSDVRLYPRFLTSRQSVKTSQASPATPTAQRFTPVTCNRFRLFPVRSPLLGESQLISVPPGTEMVQFPGSPPRHLWIQWRVTHRQTRRVTPFGHPGISGCVLLPPASRSLPRPSSYSSS